MERSDGKDFCNFTESSSGNTLFDASQYEFFGQNVVGEVELGGLEDDEEDALVFASANDDEYRLFDRGEAKDKSCCMAWSRQVALGLVGCIR
ncbi:uncharacterized protein LOC110821589 isoform X2 [Carica papaya]|uniref:uncharacterized protein LOC110821589 isoform X2 n=1 Tax=Carica papaya TaxID=3649 RepID=UPI000B8C7128|nr:uncharacterized protein LOC110821589 isoform X2 [Carica papaya]